MMQDWFLNWGLAAKRLFRELNQCILPVFLPMETPRFKYPRTFHLPYSQRKGDDDKVWPSDELFRGMDVVVTEKMDGENTTVYADYLHARSIDSDWDESKRWLDRMRQLIAPDIPAGWRICGENLFYKHTIPYRDLDGADCWAFDPSRCCTKASTTGP